MRNAGSNIYLLGAPESDCDEPGNFLKRMFGLIRFAVNKRDGQIEGEKLAAAMGASKDVCCSCAHCAKTRQFDRLVL